MGRFKDRTGRDMALAMTHEEVISDLMRKEIRSYRQLPLLLYHIQTKWRDDPRPRAGLIRVREFTMKDSYSLDADWEGLDRQYRAHYQAYFNIFRLCGLDVIAVGADVGMMGGSLAHEFMYLTPIGEDTLLLCDACGYAANRQIARFQKKAAPAEETRPLVKVATPECKSIESLAEFLHISSTKTAKAVFLMATVSSQTAPGGVEEIFVFAIVRGDLEVNETKLANAVKARSLRPAVEEEIRAIGAEPGYASPVGLLRDRVNYIVVVDDLIPQSTNLVAGANEPGYHLMNVNYGRDYQADIIADISAARQDDGCPECGAPLRSVRGVEVGNIFKLGTRYSQALGCTFQDKERVDKPVIMGSYGIGLGRLLACVAEQHHDDHGLIWPITIAPYQVHLTVLVGKKTTGEEPGGNATEQAAEKLYQELQSAHIEVLMDDRPESPGVKFNDADLIGLPLRITIGERSLQQGGIELKRRDQTERRIIPLDRAIADVQKEIQALKTEINARMKPENY